MDAIGVERESGSEFEATDTIILAVVGKITVMSEVCVFVRMQLRIFGVTFFWCWNWVESATHLLDTKTFEIDL